MKLAEVIEKPIEVTVRTRRVSPTEFKSAQDNIVALEQDVSDKQKAIEKLQSDFNDQLLTITGLEERIVNLEGVSP